MSIAGLGVGWCVEVALWSVWRPRESGEWGGWVCWYSPGCGAARLGCGLGGVDHLGNLTGLEIRGNLGVHSPGLHI